MVSQAGIDADAKIDRAIWATWYDLDGDGRDDFLAWLNGAYLPALRDKPGYLWVAHYRDSGGGDAMQTLREQIIVRPDEDVGSGSQFLMLVGAATPDAFLDPSVLEPDPGDGAEVRDMLALRCGVRTSLFIEEMRIHGPAPRDEAEGLTPAPAIQMGSLCMRTVAEEVDLGRWYRLLRLPSMAKTPGCVAARKLLSIAGWAKHGILYEFASLDDRLRYFEETQEAKTLDPTHWTGRIVRATIHAPGSPTVGARTWPPVP